MDAGEFVVPSPRLWSFKDTQMHLLTATDVTGTTSGVVERFGLREWSVINGRIALNGKIVKLKGWNHHHQWPAKDGISASASMTEEQMAFDIEQMKAAGANFVREPTTRKIHDGSIDWTRRV